MEECGLLLIYTCTNIFKFQPPDLIFVVYSIHVKVLYPTSTFIFLCYLKENWLITDASAKKHSGHITCGPQRQVALKDRS